MLRYLAAGKRRFGLYPMSPHHRVNWEFYAVVRGRVAAVTEKTPDPKPRERVLWVFPPETAHGWAGAGSQAASVCAFHFGMVPQPLADLAREREMLECPLTEEEARSIHALVHSLMPHYNTPNSASHLHWDKALLDLTLLVLGKVDRTQATSVGATNSLKVENALNWLSARLPEQPGLPQIARAVGVSESHLRRLFHQVRKQSPHEAVLDVKMHHAMELMARTDSKLDVVCAACGFSSSVDFCRAFKTMFGISPTTWRKTRLQEYTENLPAWRRREEWITKLELARKSHRS